MKTTTAFRAYTARRSNESIERAKSLGFLVRSLNKDGSVSKFTPSANEWRLNAFADQDAAEARRVQLEKMNPGSRYVVTNV
jgi:hypothetical protein